MCFKGLSATHLHRRGSLTGIHDDVAPDFRLPVVPGGFEALCEADAEIFEVPFAHQGLGGAGGDQRALDGEDQRRARVEIYAVIGLVKWQEEGLLRPRGGMGTVQGKRNHLQVTLHSVLLSSAGGYK